MGNVVINGLTAVHAGSQGTLNTVDVCKTPSKCRPNAFNNVAKSGDAARTASSVMVNGNPACNKDSIFAVSSGDEGGSCGGVSSGTIKGKAEFITFSSNVFIEGKPAVRQTDLMVSNNRNTPPMPLQQPGAGMPPELRAEEANTVEDLEKPFGIGITVAGETLALQQGLIEITLAEEEGE